MLAALAFTSPGEQLTVLLAGLAVIAMIASTVDIACDGFTVEQLHGRVRGWGNVMQVGGGYLGMTLGAGLFLVLVGKCGWWIAMLSMASLAMLLTLPALLSHEPPGAAAPDHTARPSLRAAFARAPIRLGLLVLVLFQVAPRMVQGIAGPFLVDRGADLVTLGMVSGPLGTAVSLGSVLLAGLIVRRWEATGLLRTVLILHGLIFIALVIALSVPSVPLTVYFVLSLAENGIMAGAFVILYTAAMQWSSLRQAGVDFTLFQCADAAIAAVAGMGAATLTHQAGYRTTFILAMVLVALAVALLPALLRRVGSEVAEDAR
jgi:MFS transporter (putative signal transducer)